MNKNEIKNLPVWNTNHQRTININDLPCGRTIFKVKQGRKFVCFAEFSKDMISTAVIKYDYSNKDFSKYGHANIAFYIVRNDKVWELRAEDILNANEIMEAIAVLQHHFPRQAGNILN